MTSSSSSSTATEASSIQGPLPAERLLAITQDGVWDWHIDTGVVVFSDGWCAMLGYRPDEVAPRVSSWEAAVHPDDWPAIRASLEPHLRGETPQYQCEHRLRSKDGSWRLVLDRGMVTERAPDGTALRMLGSHVDLTWRTDFDAVVRRAQTISAAQLQMLQQVVQGVGADELLTQITEFVERLAPEVQVAVLVPDGEGTTLRYRHAPSLPTAYLADMVVIPIGPDAGSCGTAAYTRTRVVVDDIATDTRWARPKRIALTNGLRACTSVPLETTGGDLLGVLAFYRRQVGPLATEHEPLLDFACHLAAIVLQRETDEQSRRMREADQRFLADLTGELQRVLSVRERGALGVRRLAEHLQLPVCGWSVVDVPAQTVIVQDLFADGEVSYRGDVVPATAWPTFTTSDDLLVFRDAQSDPVYGTRYAATFEQVGWRSSLAYGLFRGDAWVGVTYVSDVVPRHWTAREQQLMRLASERIWSALDVARALDEAQRERARIEAVLAALPVGVVIADAQGAFQRVNQRVAEVWGGAPQANAVGEYAQYRGWWADSGKSIAPEEWALARALTTGETSAGEMIRIARFDGGEGVMVNSAGPIRDHDGNITGAVVVVEDITDQVKLASANAQLTEASRRKSAFVSYLSHELRTPLNAIMGFSELLHDDVLGPVSDLQREVLVDMLSSGRHLMRLLDDVLDTARIEAGRLELKKESVALKPLLDDVVGTMRPSANQQQVVLAVHLAPALRDLTFTADPARVRQVLYNYLTNAIKFTARGGRTDLHVERTASTLRFSVTDTGVGIAPEHQARLFVDFEQVEGHSRGGWGLGLALTRRLVEAHQGHVGVESTLGQGSTFWADFPL